MFDKVEIKKNLNYNYTKQQFLNIKLGEYDMNVTDIAAWWGAIIATLVFAWDIFKWVMSGTFLRLNVSPNMSILSSGIQNPDESKYILIEVSNTGDKKTTITNLVGIYFNSFWSKILCRKPDINLVVPTPAYATKPLPYILEPGEKWNGSIEQNDELEKLMETGRFYWGICHSNKSKAQFIRVS
ncbi:hypothetical protein HY745_04705 [Candidatus Desantisbacteria bacterium]|nr:hypothetical protein [Candidatus Desantisbacteria bacterium]